MAIPRRFAPLAIVLVALIVFYLAHSGYGTPSLQSHFTLDAPGYTAAVVYLLSVMPGPRPAHAVFDSLSLMHKNIPWRHPWPVLLLHAGAYDSPESQAEFRTWLRLAAGAHGLGVGDVETLVKRLEFVRTDHGLPEGIPANGGVDEPIWSQEWPGALFALIKVPCSPC